MESERDGFECGGPPVAPPGTPGPGPVPVVIDETGLVESCLQTDALVELEGFISLSNPFEENAIEVVWQPGVCDAAIVFTFTSLGGPVHDYGLVGERPGDCASGNSSGLPLYIRFTQPMPAERVVANLWNAPVNGMCRYSPSAFGLPQPEFVDETGLVESCATADDPDWRFPIPVLDDVGETRLHVNWTGTECSTKDRVTFARNGDRYTMTLVEGPTEDCEPVARRRVIIVFRERVDPNLIDWVSSDVTRSCPYSDMPDRSEVNIFDHYGIVAGCEAFLTSDPGPDDVEVTSTDGDPSHITITWPVNHVCDSNPAHLQIWGPFRSSIR